MNSKHRKTLEAIFSDPVNGGLEWARIEALLVALGCQILEGSGSSVTFEKGGKHAHFHRPHPQRESLRYRVRAVREYLTTLGVKP
ncbi:HicA toxin of toxin-antitoxin [Desulfomicrobium apsheronum]|uniref:HicA toxin of toxin-antitoxin n=1 Tax=Desulfomicrobium apsheronum TaxID=52560 RepID=A0A1I3W4Y3_9BACT|nr:type II toxin-antitoxin system HicA family toxin [Desulfomicrobium apsheronum]SFK02500.1 HicA toxin of toxin-antitoxin [Desulfomicrobium apsheronum]